MEQAIKTDYLKNLQVATSFDANKTTPYLFQLLGQRKMIAKELLRAGGTEEDYQDKIEIYNYLNGQIKLVLGL